MEHAYAKLAVCVPRLIDEDNEACCIRFMFYGVRVLCEQRCVGYI